VQKLNNPFGEATLLRFAGTVAENLNNPGVPVTLLRFSAFVAG